MVARIGPHMGSIGTTAGVAHRPQRDTRSGSIPVTAPTTERILEALHLQAFR